jgi:predicted 3-demethylubiquinone-9 3-methyltransferase (glyoxalase superfamily)
VIFLSSFSYKEQYAVIVICKDEKEQETIYNRLKTEGFQLKVVAV